MDPEDDSPNGLNQDKLLSRLRNVIEVARIEQDLSGLEVVGALVIVLLDTYSSLPKEEAD